jgi:hypothetical protein
VIARIARTYLKGHPRKASISRKRIGKYALTCGMFPGSIPCKFHGIGGFNLPFSKRKIRSL